MARALARALLLLPALRGAEGTLSIEGTAGTFPSPRANWWCGPLDFSHEFSISDLVVVDEPLSHFLDRSSNANSQWLANKTALVRMDTAIAPDGEANRARGA